MHPSVRWTIVVSLIVFAVASVVHIVTDYMNLDETMQAAQVTMILCGFAVGGALFVEAARNG